MKRQRSLKSTVPKAHPPKRHATSKLPPRPQPRQSQPKPAQSARPAAPKPILPPKAVVARIVDDSERSLVDVIDNLLHSGVMLNADIILALADVDLVYLRLSALLCAADRVLPVRER